MVTLALLKTHVYDKAKEADAHTHTHKQTKTPLLDIYAVVQFWQLRAALGITALTQTASSENLD